MTVGAGIEFTMEQQTESNWCWAATAASVSAYYLPTTGWGQCGVASEVLGTQCCQYPVPAPCNVPSYLSSALTVTDNFVAEIGVASISQIIAELEAKRPVGARVGWEGGGGHFCVIAAYSYVMRMEYFGIRDPYYGQSGIPVSAFRNNYQGTGTWTHTYFTKAAS